MTTPNPESGELGTMGPISYLIVEFPGSKMTGEGFPLLADLADRGVIRILDLSRLHMLQRLLNTESLTGGQWLVVLALSLATPLAVGADKAIQLRGHGNAPPGAREGSPDEGPRGNRLSCPALNGAFPDQRSSVIQGARLPVQAARSRTEPCPR
jgi:hypothetical protein